MSLLSLCCILEAYHWSLAGGPGDLGAALGWVLMGQTVQHPLSVWLTQNHWILRLQQLAANSKKVNNWKCLQNCEVMQRSGATYPPHNKDGKWLLLSCCVKSRCGLMMAWRCSVWINRGVAEKAILWDLGVQRAVDNAEVGRYSFIKPTNLLSRVIFLPHGGAIRIVTRDLLCRVISLDIWCKFGPADGVSWNVKDQEHIHQS